MAGLGLTFTLIDLFLRTSRIQDVLFPGLHVPLIVMIFGLGALLLSARLFHFLFSPLGRLLAIFTFWMLFAVGLSVWPGGAYDHLMIVWIPTLPAFVMICAFVRTFRQLRTALVVTASGYAAVMYVALLMSTEVGVSRIGIRYFTLGDANELAMATLFFLPMAGWCLLDKRVPWWVKLHLVAASMIAVPIFFRTGSRSGLVALGVSGMYVLYRQSTAVRLRLLLVAALAGPIGVSMTPSAVLDRYTTMIPGFGGRPDPIADAATEGDEEVDERAVLSASASAQSRWNLLKRSIAVTFENPVFGVGPGMFVVAENEMAVSEGLRRGRWQVSHNMYTQVSADLGIPALVIFLMLIYRVWKVLTRAERADLGNLSFARELRKMAFALKASMAVFLTGGLTLSIALSLYLPLLCALAVVIERIIAVNQGWQAPVSPRGDAKEAGPTPTAARPEPEPVAARVALAGGGPRLV